MGLGQPTDAMRKSVYDVDGDSIVDKTESIKTVANLPAGPAEGDIVEKSGKMYVAINE